MPNRDTAAAAATRAALTDLHANLAAALRGRDPRDPAAVADIAALTDKILHALDRARSWPEASSPVALLPVRLETRYWSKANPNDTLLVRVYPDTLQQVSHDPRLNQEEIDAGVGYWKAGAREQDWARLAAAFGDTRAGWIVRRTDLRYDGRPRLSVGEAWLYPGWGLRLDGLSPGAVPALVMGPDDPNEDLDADLRWYDAAVPQPHPRIQVADYRLTPLGATTVAELRRSDYDAVSSINLLPADPPQLTYRTSELGDAALPPGTVIGVRTRAGNYAKVQVTGKWQVADPGPLLSIGDRTREILAVRWETFPPTLPPPPAPTPGVWRRAATAAAMPDQWIALAYRFPSAIDGAGGPGIPLDLVASGLGELIDQPPRIGPTPGAQPDGDGAMDAGTRWMVDFKLAIPMGMALEVPLSHLPADQRRIDRLIVLGVGTSGPLFPHTAADEGAQQLSELLAAHEFTGGLELLPPGTPTNNTSPRDRAGWASRTPDHATSHQLAHRDPLPDGADGGRLAQALGVGTDTLWHIAHAEGDVDRQAADMATVLCPATLGRYLADITGAPAQVIDTVRQLFVDHVRPGGPLPAIRVGRQPYGILPCTATSLYEPDPDLAGIPAALRQLLTEALAGVRLAPAETVDRLLERTPLSVAVGARAVFDRTGDWWAHALTFMGQHRQQLLTETAAQHDLLAGILPGVTFLPQLTRPTTAGHPAEPAWPVRLPVAPAEPRDLTDPTKAPGSLLGLLITQSAALDSGTSFRDARKRLAGLDSDTLDRLTLGGLDTLTYRLDAWFTALAARRLARIRAQPKHSGMAIGGWGVAEHLTPRTDDVVLGDQAASTAAQSEGWLYAPSLGQAAAAAVLRCGHLTHGRSTTAAIDLGAARSRLATQLADAVRSGEPLGTALGYRFERLLREIGLDPYLDDFRQLTAKPGTAALVDGQALLHLLDADALGSRIYAILDAHHLGGPERSHTAQALTWAVHALADTRDALTDALVAEAVYQTVQGNPLRAGAALQASAGGDVAMPELQFLRTPKPRTTATHRVVLNLDPASTDTPGWPTTAAGEAEPVLNAWIADQLPPAEAITIPLQLRDDAGHVLPGPTGQPWTTMTVAEAGLAPIDLVRLSPRPDALLARLAYRAGHDHPDIAGARLLDPPAAGRAGQQPWTAAGEVARAIHDLLVACRSPQHGPALTDADLTPADQPPADTTDTTDTTELQTRINATADRLGHVLERLGPALEQPVAPTNAADVEEQLVAAADLGIADVEPGRATATTTAWLPDVAAVVDENVHRLTGPITIDGVTLPDDTGATPILLTAQTAAGDNGVWTVRGGDWVRDSSPVEPGRTAVSVTATGTSEGHWLYGSDRVWRRYPVDLTALHRKAEHAVDEITQRLADAHAPSLTVRVVAATLLPALTGQTAIDDVELGTGDPVLLTEQPDPSQNGVWHAAVGAWTGPVDTPAGATVTVQAGARHAGTTWICTERTAGLPGAAAATHWSRTTSGEVLRQRLQRLLGGDITVLATLAPTNSDEITRALDQTVTADADRPDIGQGPDAWLQRMALVRPAVASLQAVALYGQAHGRPPLVFDPLGQAGSDPLGQAGSDHAGWVAQLPCPAGAHPRWSGLPIGDTVGDADPPRLALLFTNGRPFTAGHTITGMVVDSIDEHLPRAMQPTALAFHYDAPAGQPPQAILMAVPPKANPTASETWTSQTLAAVINDTLDLAELRGATDDPMRGLGVPPATQLRPTTPDRTPTLLQRLGVPVPTTPPLGSYEEWDMTSINAVRLHPSGDPVQPGSLIMQVEILGSGFQPPGRFTPVTVTIPGVPWFWGLVPPLDDDRLFSAVLRVPVDAAPGPRQVTVTSVMGTASAPAFTVGGGAITGFEPPRIVQQEQDQDIEITIRGRGLQGATLVSCYGADCQMVDNSRDESLRIRVHVPAGPPVPAGFVKLWSEMLATVEVVVPPAGARSIDAAIPYQTYKCAHGAGPAR